MLLVLRLIARNSEEGLCHIRDEFGLVGVPSIFLSYAGYAEEAFLISHEISASHSNNRAKKF